jgi:hypothetical protein
VLVYAAAVLLHSGYRKAYMDKVWKKRWMAREPCLILKVS